MSPHPTAASSTVVGGLFQDLFGTPEMRAIFCDRSLVQSWLDFEAALAQAEAKFEVVPAWAAEEIQRCAKADRFDIEELRRGIALTDHPLVSVIWRLGSIAGEAGSYLHWGATTQDVMDTGSVLQMRDALCVVEGRLLHLGDLTADLARRDRDTVMAGRTHGQHALPITFGLKAAIWLAELTRHLQRLDELRPRVLVGQLAGAAGTLAPLGEVGPQVRAELCGLLKLKEPSGPWHVARDGIAEAVFFLAMVAATCARIAHEVILLQKTEVAELEERQDDGNVGSSTMPQKRNPMTAEGAVAASRLARRSVSTALEGMIGEHERDMSAWQAEWEFLPDVCLTADAALTQTVDVLDGLSVRRKRMGTNLALTEGMLMAEAVMIELGRHIGRQQAHDLVHAAAMSSVENGRSFVDELAAIEPITTRLGGRGAIDRLLRPTDYLGDVHETIDRALHDFEAHKETCR